MLSESFLATSSAPPKITSSNHTLLKDAGIFQHSFQPELGLRKTFKNSMCSPRCLAISETHIFTAQKDKAVVHVYSREKDSQEATVPFPELIHSLAITPDGMILALGSERGAVFLWELGTGRILASPAAHLQAVSLLAVDESGSYILSGSSDSNVHVWSLGDLLAFPTAQDLAMDKLVHPLYTLSTHQGGVTALAVSRSRTVSSNYVVIGATDSSITIWNYSTGELLRTILVSAVPTSLALDPADRALYVGLQDGSVQIVDFYRLTTTESIFSVSATPLQPPKSDRMFPPPNSQIGTVHAISLSYDSTTLLSAHESGAIISWDIASRTYTSVIAEYPEAAITNLQFLAPTGWPNPKPPRLKLLNVIKPKAYENFSSSSGQLMDSYVLHSKFPSSLDLVRSDRPSLRKASNFSEGLMNTINYPGVPPSLLATNVSELLTWKLKSNNEDTDEAEDFVALSVDQVADTSRQRIEALEKQVEHLKKMQRISAQQVQQLTQEKAELERSSHAK